MSSVLFKDPSGESSKLSAMQSIDRFDVASYVPTLTSSSQWAIPLNSRNTSCRGLLIMSPGWCCQVIAYECQINGVPRG